MKHENAFVEFQEILHFLAWVAAVLSFAGLLAIQVGRAYTSNVLQELRTNSVKDELEMLNVLSRRRGAPSKKNIFLIKLLYSQLNIQQLLRLCVGGSTLISSLLFFFYVRRRKTNVGYEINKSSNGKVPQAMLLSFMNNKLISLFFAQNNFLRWRFREGSRTEHFSFPFSTESRVAHWQSLLFQIPSHFSCSCVG